MSKEVSNGRRSIKFPIFASSKISISIYSSTNSTKLIVLVGQFKAVGGCILENIHWVELSGQLGFGL